LKQLVNISPSVLLFLVRPLSTLSQDVSFSEHLRDLLENLIHLNGVCVLFKTWKPLVVGLHFVKVTLNFDERQN